MKYVVNNKSAVSAASGKHHLSHWLILPMALLSLSIDPHFQTRVYMYHQISQSVIAYPNVITGTHIYNSRSYF